MLPDDRDFGPATPNGSASSWISVLRPQADCAGASSRLQQSRARCEQVRMTAAIFFAKTEMSWLVYDARQLIEELDRVAARKSNISPRPD